MENFHKCVEHAIVDGNSKYENSIKIDKQEAAKIAMLLKLFAWSMSFYLFCKRILAYDIFHGRLDLQQAESFEAPSDRDLRGHDFKLRHRSFCLLRRKAAFSVRRLILRNKFTRKIVNSPTPDTFKRLLDKE